MLKTGIKSGEGKREREKGADRDESLVNRKIQREKGSGERERKRRKKERRIRTLSLSKREVSRFAFIISPHSCLSLVRPCLLG